MEFDRKTVERIKAQYPKGTRLRVMHMTDKYPVPDGSLATVDHVDDIGTIHCKFDNGRYLGVIQGVDSFHVVQTREQLNARKEADDLTESEKRLHDKLVEIAKDIAARAANGEDSFDIDKLFEEHDFRSPIIHAISEMVGNMPGIKHSAVHDIGIPFQNTLKVMPDEVSEDDNEEQTEDTDETEDIGMNMQ